MIAFPKKRSICLLFALLGANVVLYAWFASRTRETSADEIVQKAYIVSRLVSDAAGRSIILDDPQILKSAVAEAFKDRHIVSVTVIDDKEKVLFESATTRAAVNPSTFRTPVKLGKKREGTLIAAFSINDEDARISSRLHTTALIQLGLLAAVAILLTITARRPARAGSATGDADQHAVILQPLLTSNPIEPVTADDAGSPAALVPIEADLPLLDFSCEPPTNERFAPPVYTLQEQPPPSPPPPESPVIDLFNACRTLQQAAQLLSDEASLQHRTRQDSSQYVTQINDWQQQALQAAVRVDLLLATGEEIVSQVRELTAAQETGNRAWLAVGQSHRRALLEAVATLERAGELLAASDPGQQMASTANIESLSQGSAIATADVVLEGASIMRDRAIPAVVLTLAAVKQVGCRLDALQTQLNECGDRSIAIGRAGTELSDLADALRLLRRHTETDDATNAAEEIRRQQLATRLETIAATLKQESRDLLGSTNEANALGRAADAECSAAQLHLLQVGAAVEDAAATAVLGSNYLRHDGRQFAGKGDPDSSLAELTQLLQTLRVQLIGQVQLLVDLADNDDRQAVECAQSLAVACDTLRLAGKFLAEMTATTLSLAEKGAHDPVSVSADATIAVEKLISEACARLVQHLPSADRQV